MVVLFPCLSVTVWVTIYFPGFDKSISVTEMANQISTSTPMEMENQTLTLIPMTMENRM